MTVEPRDSSIEILRRLIQPGLEEVLRGELVVGPIEEILDEIDRKLDAADEQSARDGQRGSPE